MSLRGLLLSFCIFLSSAGHAQKLPNLIPYVKVVDSGKWTQEYYGLMDTNQRIIVPATYDYINFFREDIISLCKYNNYPKVEECIYLNNKGEEIGDLPWYMDYYNQSNHNGVANYRVKNGLEEYSIAFDSTGKILNQYKNVPYDVRVNNGYGIVEGLERFKNVQILYYHNTDIVYRYVVSDTLGRKALVSKDKKVLTPFKYAWINQTAGDCLRAFAPFSGERFYLDSNGNYSTTCNPDTLGMDKDKIDTVVVGKDTIRYYAYLKYSQTAIHVKKNIGKHLQPLNGYYFPKTDTVIWEVDAWFYTKTDSIWIKSSSETPDNGKHETIYYTCLYNQHGQQLAAPYARVLYKPDERYWHVAGKVEVDFGIQQIYDSHGELMEYLMDKHGNRLSPNVKKIRDAMLTPWLLVFENEKGHYGVMNIKGEIIREPARKTYYKNDAKGIVVVRKKRKNGYLSADGNYYLSEKLDLSLVTYSVDECGMMVLGKNKRGRRRDINYLVNNKCEIVYEAESIEYNYLNYGIYNVIKGNQGYYIDYKGNEYIVKERGVK